MANDDTPGRDKDPGITLSIRMDRDARIALGRIAARRSALPSAVAREIVNEYLYDHDAAYASIVNQRIAEQEEKFRPSSESG